MITNIVNVLMCFNPQLAKHEWAKNADINKNRTQQNHEHNNVTPYGDIDLGQYWLR